MKINYPPPNISYLALFFVAPIFLFTIINQSQNLKSYIQKTNTSPKGKLAGSAIPAPALLPIKTTDNPLAIQSKAAYVVDLNSMSVLYQQNQNTTLPIASIAKLMTALLAIEHYRPDHWLMIGDLKTDGSNIGLALGDTFQVKDLLGALLIGSANDAAETLASNFPGGASGFVWAMNQKAQELGMQNTNFVNPIGYDNPNQYSTARDLAILGVEVMKNPQLSFFVAQKNITISDATKTKTLLAKNTNELLTSDPSVLGVKTGWTENAGECLLSFVNRENHPILTVILGSSNRFEESERLINWIYQTYQWKPIS